MKLNRQNHKTIASLLAVKNCYEKKNGEKMGKKWERNKDLTAKIKYFREKNLKNSIEKMKKNMRYIFLKNNL